MHDRYKNVVFFVVGKLRKYGIFILEYYITVKVIEFCLTSSQKYKVEWVKHHRTFYYRMVPFI